MMMMTKTTHTQGWGISRYFYYFILARERSDFFVISLQEPTGRFVIKAKFYDPRKSLSRA